MIRLRFLFFVQADKHDRLFFSMSGFCDLPAHPRHRHTSVHYLNHPVLIRTVHNRLKNLLRNTIKILRNRNWVVETDTYKALQRHAKAISRLMLKTRHHTFNGFFNETYRKSIQQPLLFLCQINDICKCTKKSGA